MRKEVLVAVAILFLLPLVAAPVQPPEVVHTVRPTITLSFDEPIVLKRADFFSENFSVTIPATNASVNASVLQFSPVTALANGIYTFTAVVEDLVGNTRTHTKRFAVDVPDTRIALIIPPLGRAANSPFDLSIGTTFEGNPELTDCRYSLQDPLFNFFTFGLFPFDSAIGGNTHSKFAFVGPVPNFILPTPFFAICTDSRGRVLQQQFNLFVDTISPTITTIELDPALINERSAGGVFRTMLKITASEPVICKYSTSTLEYAAMRPFDNFNVGNATTFKSNTNQSVTDFDPNVPVADYTIAVGCQDRAGRETGVHTRNIQVDMSEVLSITILSPNTPFVSVTNIPLTLRTNKNAHCLFAESPADPVTPFTPTASQVAARQHTATLGGVSEGTHLINVLCTSTASGAQEVAEQQITFTVDRSAPDRPVIEGPSITCHNDGFIFLNDEVLTFTSADGESGLSHFLFTLRAPNGTILVNRSRSAGTLTSITAADGGRALVLAPRANHALSVIAVDNAGKESSAATHTLKFDPTARICLEKNPPTVTLLQEPVLTGIRVTVQCRDDTACDNSSIKIDNDPEAANCAPSTRLFPPFQKVLSSTQFLCYNVSDINDNSVAESELILVNLELSVRCNNLQKDGDETDIDCGGSCAPCRTNRRCVDNTDCQSAFCDEAFCRATSCTDGVQNGLEIGVDCGASCPRGCDLNTLCTIDTDCGSRNCESGRCAPGSCLDGSKNGNETDVDCGGGCNGCLTNQTCRASGDCTSSSCRSGVCAPPPSCTDNVKNGDETDVDCGGNCPTCAVGESCTESLDCGTLLCLSRRCAVPPSCTDGLKNGNETDTDCGGQCADCDVNKVCRGSEDCASNLCRSSRCAIAPTCSDGTKNGNETDTDCGGQCGKCDASKVCRGATDCVSDRCVSGKCVAPLVSPTCADGTKNGNETDTDCGGQCGKCDEDQICRANTDCNTGLCRSNRCVLGAGCSDRVKNGNETDTDCGGQCADCDVNKICRANTDCASNRCINGKCATSSLVNLTSTCTNFVKDANESDVDCGGDCIPCDDAKICRAGQDCLSSFCTTAKKCERATCTDNAQNGDEKGKDCGGNCPTACAEGTTCVFNSECATGFCDPATRKCAASSCTDGTKNGQETGKDCGGGCPKCGEGESCKADGDCGSNRCSFGFCTSGKTGQDQDPSVDKKDTDNDGIPDEVEIANDLDPNDPTDADQDLDSDDLTNLVEIRKRTDIRKADTDGDGFSDGEEVEAGSDPLDPEDVPTGSGSSMLSYLPLVVGLLLLLYGLWALAYNRYVAKPSTSKSPTLPAPLFTGPTPVQASAQRRMSFERDQRIGQMREKMRTAEQSKLKDRLKIFDLFGGKEEAPGPASNNRAPARERTTEPSAPSDERSGWLWMGNKEETKGRATDTFNALEELGKKSGSVSKGDPLSALRGLRRKKRR